MKGVALKDRLNRIFEPSDNKIVIMAEIEHLGWGESRKARM